MKEIYTQNGILGFFNGLIPRLLGDICSLLLASSLTYAINHYIVEERELKVYTSATMTVSYDKIGCDKKYIMSSIRTI